MADSIHPIVHTIAVYTGMQSTVDGHTMKNITLSADESLIEAARARANTEKTTLNEQFRRWLAAYAQTDARMSRYDAVMKRVQGRLKMGHKLSREAVNER